MSRSTSKRNLHIGIAILVILILVGISVSAYYYTSSTASTPMSSSTTMISVSGSSSPLILYSADAYVAESTTLEDAFTSNTGIQMAPPKAGGSLLLAREISQGNPVSVFISVARPAVQPLYLGNESSGWAIAFATDQMSLAYSNVSLQNPAANTVLGVYTSAAASNTTADWAKFFTIISSGQVKVGFGNPNADPAGYRGWIVLETAGQAYAQNSSTYVNRITSNEGNVTGASAADLVGPLETGQIQFLFIYKSSAIAHKLNYLLLPDQVNLGSSKYSQYYSNFSYKLTSGVQKGGLIALYITVPKDSTDTADSMRFVVFVIKNSPTLLSSYGLVPFTPARLYNSTTLPDPLQLLINEGYLQPSGTL